jgi:hypothetical protein
MIKVVCFSVLKKTQRGKAGVKAETGTIVRKVTNDDDDHNFQKGYLRYSGREVWFVKNKCIKDLDSDITGYIQGCTQEDRY